MAGFAAAKPLAAPGRRGLQLFERHQSLILSRLWQDAAGAEALS